MQAEADLLRHRVLVIDDNPAIHADYRKILTSEGHTQQSAAEAGLFGAPPTDVARPVFDVDAALQGRDGVELARAALAQGRPYSVAFVDMRMPPGWDGLETIENLWKVDPDVQVVICSAYTDYDWLELLARLGHSDKLIVVKKPFEPIEILQCASALSRKWQNARALKRHVESLELVVTDRTKGLEAANRQLRHLASHDALTGLPNRLLFDDRIAQAIAQAQRQAHEFAVMIVDLDRFKLINDSLGHRAGDDLLRVVAQRLSHAVRAIDTTARIGGDEFVILLGGPVTHEEAIEIAERALVPPGDFIMVAGECGLLDAIGEWVLLEACRQAKAWQREGLRPLRVAVNLAPSQFRLANLVDQIRRALDAAALDPQFLEVELTESAVMSDAEESIRILEAVSRMGVLVSVDDFGTGYSSMSYLRRFPIDKLKIDRCFVEDMTRRPEDASIVRAIISLAHSLRLKVIAEGVETPEQLALLAQLGCDQYQGFHFSPAVLPAAFAALVRQEPADAEDEASRTHSKLAALVRARS